MAKKEKSVAELLEQVQDILAEIHKSKTTYCYFATKDDHQYDFIIDYEDNNNLQRSLEYASRPETIQRAK
jgi:hypothetical protein